MSAATPPSPFTSPGRSISARSPVSGGALHHSGRVIPTGRPFPRPAPRRAGAGSLRRPRREGDPPGPAHGKQRRHSGVRHGRAQACTYRGKRPAARDHHYQDRADECGRTSAGQWQRYIGGWPLRQGPGGCPLFGPRSTPAQSRGEVVEDAGRFKELASARRPFS